MIPSSAAFRSLRRATGLLLALVAPASPAGAQSLNADAGLSGYGRPEHWLPIRLNLINQGQAARVQVRARVSHGRTGGSTVYESPQRSVPGGAFEQHFFYAFGASPYSNQPVSIQLLRDGRPAGRPLTPGLTTLGGDDVLVVGIGPSESLAALNLIAGTTLQSGFRTARRSAFSGGAPGRIYVGLLPPQATPDRYQGLQAADAIVLGQAGDREFAPEQQAAIRGYVAAGGTLILPGGAGAPRLTAGFYRELLPVDVTGTQSLASHRGDGALVPPAGSAHLVGKARLQPRAEVLSSLAGTPMVVRGSYGHGRVYYLAFDPLAPPYAGGPQSARAWRLLLETRPSAGGLIAQIEGQNLDPYGYGYGPGSYVAGNPNAILANAPYAISQLDIPGFYLVALFLLAYIIVLVPVNYYVLKRRDRKELAWVTTPVIVLIFSVLAYGIGYGFKGGRALLSRVTVVEGREGSPLAPAITYAGLFSPRKTTYDVRPAGEEKARAGRAGGMLISIPSRGSETLGLRVGIGETQQFEDMAVDMWAMRVLRGESLVDLGKGVTGRFAPAGGGFSAEIRNGSSYSLTGCRLVTGAGLTSLPDLPPGGSAAAMLRGKLHRGAVPVLPLSLMQENPGERGTGRMQRAALIPLCTQALAGPGIPASLPPTLLAWIREPAAQLEVDGRRPVEQAVQLLLVHLDGAPPDR